MLTRLIDARRILVAVSGGADSTALLIALQESSHDVVAAHYDHALREGSDAVARRVSELCAARGIPLISERRIEPLPKGSLQAAARELRYAFLERARIQSGATLVVTAHTADDVVEGAVLHLLRGCGLAGLRGVPERRGHYFRPWLDVWRAEITEFLEAKGIQVHADPANRDLRFARVRVRLEILPALERDRPGIVRRIHAAARAAARRQEQAEAMPTPAEALKRLYAAAGGPQPGLSRRHIRAMLRLTETGRGGRGVDLPGGLRFRIVGGHLEMIRSRPAGTVSKPRLLVKDCAGCDEREAAHLRVGLALRLGHRIPGMRMRPEGGRGTRKLQDIFVDARVPREERDAWPLVLSGDRLAWIPGVAIDADLMSRPGEPAQHVSVSPFPVNFSAKVARLDSPHRPSGDQI